MGVSAIALVVASFLDWFTATIDATNAIIMQPDGTLGDLGVGKSPVSGWGVDFWYVWTLPPVLIALGTLVVTVTTGVSPRARLAEAPINPGVAGLVAAGFVVAKLIVGDEIAEDNMFDVTVDPSIGIYIALIATIGLSVGGFLHAHWRAARGSDATA